MAGRWWVHDMVGFMRPETAPGIFVNFRWVGGRGEKGWEGWEVRKGGRYSKDRWSPMRGRQLLS